ncbi:MULTISPECIES: hypothetical protein [unclassified Oceanobacillus]|uniref:hypothetical protein n=1 Tax=unclassified Oceanobacillus TaxID=2630292 RepID=UPI001BED2E94|nr:MULTISPECIES: hypothetical protein [unclassified Oceanobacillus]MBT2599078.1 hypothetical protein [Oceanobacillus sp. ISL-74]MBT2651996.1 hypothetical protein [Oceanobacillus sp. ISL-73]
MMDNYEFTETGSRNVEENGEQVRLVNFRGVDSESVPYEKLNVDGSFTMPMIDYFTAGMEGTLPKVIREYVVNRFTPEETQ